MYGMNVEEVRNLGRTLQTKAEEIRSMVSLIDGQVSNANWLGPDADQFKGQWWPEHKNHLLAAAEGIHGFGQSALNNAQEQEDVANR